MRWCTSVHARVGSTAARPASAMARSISARRASASSRSRSALSSRNDSQVSARAVSITSAYRGDQAFGAHLGQERVEVALCLLGVDAKAPAQLLGEVRRRDAPVRVLERFPYHDAGRVEREVKLR